MSKVMPCGENHDVQNSKAETSALRKTRSHEKTIYHYYRGIPVNFSQKFGKIFRGCLFLGCGTAAVRPAVGLAAMYRDSTHPTGDRGICRVGRAIDPIARPSEKSVARCSRALQA